MGCQSLTVAFSRRLGLAALLAVAVVACGDPGAKLARHEEAGEQYLASEQWAEAAIEFRNMVQIDPNSAAGHWGLARALLGQKDGQGGYWELQETVRLDPENIEARLQYGQFLLFGKPEDVERAVQTADEILAARPTSWQAWVLRARALAALRRSEEVGPALQKAAEVAPQEPGPQLLYANYLRSEGRDEEAEALFRKVVALEPGFPAHAALAGFLASLDRDEEAEHHFRKGIELAKPEERVAAYTMLANFLMARDRDDQVEQVLREGIAAEGEHVDLIYSLARFYHARGRRDEADAMILEATRADPSDPQPFLLLSNYRAQNGDLDGALEAAEQALQADPDQDLARLRKAEVLVDIGYRRHEKERIAQGRAIVEAVLGRETAQPQALFVKAKIELADGHLDEAIAAARRALDAKDSWPQAHYLLGSALFLSGDRNGARAEVSRAIELDPNLVDAYKLLARIHAVLGDHKLAVESASRVLDQGVEDDALRILKAQSQVRLGDLSGALKELERIPADRRDAEVEYALGRVLRLQGELEGARKHLLAAQEQEPHRYEILRTLLDLELREGDIRESIARVKAAVEARPDDARLRQLSAEVALYTGRTQEAEEEFRRAIELDPNDLRGYEALARFLALTGQSDEVLATYERALERNPEQGPLHLMVGSLYEMKGRVDDAIRHYEEAIRLEPGLAVAKNNLAYLLAERGERLDRALDLAQEAKASLPDNPNTADTLGWVLFKKHVPSAAIDYLKEAVGGMQPDDAQISLVQHHLALAYEADGQTDKAQQVWSQALAQIEHRQAASEGDAPTPPEPPWAGEIRAGLERIALGP